MNRLVAAVLLLEICVLLTGCGSGSTPDASQPDRSEDGGKAGTSVSFWTYCTTPERDLDFQNFAQVLKKEYPDIALDYVGSPGDIPTFAQKLDVAIASDTAPDLTDYYDSKYIRNGFYEPLDTYFDRWAGKDSLDPAAVEKIRSFDPQGRTLYALPFSTQPWGMWVRKDLLEAAGLSIPRTWDEFFTAVQKLTDKEKDQYGIALRGGPGSSNTLEALMYSYSGLTEYFDQNGKCTVNHPKNVEFVKRYLGLYNQYSAKDDLIKGWTQLTASFQAGKAAIIFHNFGSGTSMDAAFHNDSTKYQAVTLPGSADGKTGSRFMMMRAAAINSKSKVKDAAFQTMTVYCGAAVQVPRCKTQGEVPVDRDALAVLESRDDTRPYIRLAVQLVSEGGGAEAIDPPVYLPEYSEIQTAVEPMVQKVMTGKMSAEAMLNQWAQMLEKAQRNFEGADRK